MTQLTRETRFTLPLRGEFSPRSPANGLAGNYPVAAGDSDEPGIYCVLQVTLAGEPEKRSSYIENIKSIDRAVYSSVAPRLTQLLQAGRWTLSRAVMTCRDLLVESWPEKFVSVQLWVNPFLKASANRGEKTMVFLTQRFEFSAAHRLHNRDLDESANREIFGKCNNPAGHGHNYEFEVTLGGEIDEGGRLINPDEFAAIVNASVIDRFDHKHLNEQTAEFADVIPSVENIAKVIYELLDREFARPRLISVRVWETGKTWAEYSRQS